jgi:hypothetical protein
MPDNAGPIAPEDRPATQRDVATALPPSNERVMYLETRRPPQ